MPGDPALQSPVLGKPGRKATLAAFSLALLLLAVLYGETARSMVEIWYRSETFNHGFVVLPISLWLIWQRRAQLSSLPLSQSLWAMPVLAAMALAWLLGELAGVNAVTQFAWVGMLILLVPTVLGAPIASAIAFPLAFLLFMVPVGEFAMPTLMDWTARVTVLALRLTGIPVYQEGLQFVLPSGKWSVVEACSGLRYLIASFCVGTLYAYLNYQSYRRRAVFMIVSLLVPIVANWMRAYMIVMIGHLSGGKLAVGVDHLIYGWVFFGIVIGIMFALGARWADTGPLKDRQEKACPEPSSTYGARPSVIALAFAILVIPYGAVRFIEHGARALPAVADPLPAIAGWSTGGAPLAWKPAFGEPDWSGSAVYQDAGVSVGLHVVYYRGQDNRRKLVSSNNVLASSTDSQWATVSSGRARTELGGRPVPVRSAELRSPGEQRIVVWHWYWINGRIVTNDHEAKLLIALDRLAGRGDDSAGVFIVTAKDGGAPESALDAFARAADGPLAGFLTRIRDSR